MFTLCCSSWLPPPRLRRHWNVFVFALPHPVEALKFPKSPIPDNRIIDLQKSWEAP